MLTGFLAPDFYLIAFISIAMFLLGLVVFLRDKQSITSSSFFFLSLIMSIWSVTNYLSLHSPTEETTLFWIRIVMAITSFLGPVVFIFLHSFPDKKLPLNTKIAMALGAVSVSLSIFSMTPFLFESVQIVDGNITPKPGPVLPLFMLTFFATSIAGFISVFRKFRRSTGLVKMQIRYLFIGIGLSFVLFTATNLVAVVFLRTSQYVFLGPLFFLIMLAFVSYAIVKHRLLNITGLIARTLSYTLVFITISATYVVLLFVTTAILFPAFFSNQQVMMAVTTVLALFVAFTLPAIRSFFEGITDKLLYKNKFDPQVLFNQVAETITSTLDMLLLTKDLLLLLEQELRCTHVSAALKRDTDFLFYQSGNASEKDPPISKVVGLVQNTKSPMVVFDELESSPLKEWMQTYDVTIILSLEVKGELIGFLLFGPKASGEIYYDNDLKVLPAIADQLAIAFQNALAFLQISQFNATLKSEIEKATKDLSKANEELKALDKLKDEFLSMASHELKSPMNAIKNYLWMAMNKGKDQPERLPEFLSTAYQATQRLIAMVNDLLDVSRIESGRVRLEIKPLNLHVFVKETISIFEPEAQKKSLKIHCELQDDLKVKADEQKLREIIGNFISNAIKYTLQGSVTIKAEVKDQLIRLSITDTGPGISASDQAKLFQKFSRVNASNKDLAFIDGTGLGLYITKKFTEMMGGSVGVISELNKGTTFWVELPKA